RAGKRSGAFAGDSCAAHLRDLVPDGDPLALGALPRCAAPQGDALAAPAPGRERYRQLQSAGHARLAAGRAAGLVAAPISQAAAAGPNLVFVPLKPSIAPGDGGGHSSGARLKNETIPFRSFTNASASPKSRAQAALGAGLEWAREDVKAGNGQRSNDG